MAYEKKDNYPNVKLKGIYPSGSIKELGLDGNDLEKFSLGNWNSLFRGNKLILGGDLLSDIQEEDIEVKVRTSPPKDGTRVLVWRYKRRERENGSYAEVTLTQGPIIEYLSDREYWSDNSNKDTAAVKRSRLMRTNRVYKRFYGDDNVVLSGGSKKRTAFNFNGLDTNKALTFENDEGTISTDNGEDIILKINEDSRDKLQYHVIERALTQQEINNWGSGNPSAGNDKEFTHELVVLVEFDVQAKNLTTDDLETFENTKFSLNVEGPGNEYSIDTMAISEGHDRDTFLGQLEEKGWWEYGRDANSWNNYRLDYPRDSVASITLRGLEYNLYTGPKPDAKDDIPFRASTNRDDYYDGSGIGRELLLGSPYNGGYGYYRAVNDAYGANITAIEFDSGYDVRPLIGTETGVRAFEWPEEFRFSISQTREIGNRDVQPDRPLGAGEDNYDIPYSPLRGTNNPIYPPLLESNIIELWDQHFSFLGYPDFEFDIVISDSEYLNGLETFDTPIDFIVNAKTPDNNDFLYYDNKEKPEKYRNTSFPMMVNLNIDLYDFPNFINTTQNFINITGTINSVENNPIFFLININEPYSISDISVGMIITINGNEYEIINVIDNAIVLNEGVDEPVATDQEVFIIGEIPPDYDNDDLKTVFSSESTARASYLNQVFNVEESAENPNNCYYEYEVIQWGDEETLLSDKQIKNSYFFSFYDSVDDFDINNFYFKKYQQAQSQKSKPIQEDSNHIYNSSGVKTIKIIVYRYTKNKTFVLQTYLVTKNILVNDGNLVSQDFSLFGGTDFNFLPVKTKTQAIVGGLDTDSDYNNSVFKIVKDDNFVQEDYLERVSSKQYITDFNNGFFGKSPGQLDLGQTRVFTKPKDIYDFIGGDKLEWINQGSGSLPLNSLATDIFIRDEKCVVDLNPSNSEFLTIQNQAGVKEQGIIIGDYKVNQPKNGKVQKQSVMKTPLLESDNNKQAF